MIFVPQTLPHLILERRYVSQIIWESVEMTKLTAFSVKAFSKPGGHGDGLYLYVSLSGTKSRAQRIVINDKRRYIGLGSNPSVSEGRDPLSEKREAKEAVRNPSPSVPTFAEAAVRVIEFASPNME